MVISLENKIISFTEPIDFVELPTNFPSPFSESPHPLAKIASRQLIHFLESDPYWENVPLFDDLKGHKRIGKMFGVLVVEDSHGNLGFLAAFSGKLLGENIYPHFVPPVFDMLEKDGFYVKEEAHLLELSKTIKDLEKSTDYLELKESTALQVRLAEQEWDDYNRMFKDLQKKRRQKLEHVLELGDSHLEEELRKEGIQEKYTFKEKKKAFKVQVQQIRIALEQYEEGVKKLKQERKERSKRLQEKLYQQYQFLNSEMESRHLKSIFNDRDVPPSGSGECAAPKLFHYAFKHGLKPICMAEFWWGRSPNSKQKQHQEFYPSCEEKCRPILTHMLKGMV